MVRTFEYLSAEKVFGGEIFISESRRPPQVDIFHVYEAAGSLAGLSKEQMAEAMPSLPYMLLIN